MAKRVVGLLEKSGDHYVHVTSVQVTADVGHVLSFNNGSIFVLTPHENLGAIENSREKLSKGTRRCILV